MIGCILKKCTGDELQRLTYTPLLLHWSVLWWLNTIKLEVCVSESYMTINSIRTSEVVPGYLAAIETNWFAAPLFVPWVLLASACSCGIYCVSLFGFSVLFCFGCYREKDVILTMYGWSLKVNTLLRLRIVHGRNILANKMKKYKNW